ncbi:MAG: Hsp20 family protein [Terriglobales bacterium]
MRERSAVERTSAPAVVRLLPDDRFWQRIADLRQLIARRAYELFAEGGAIHGHDLEHWLQAEAQLLMPAPVEILDAPEAITVKCALPGFSASNIEIHVEPQHLFISGQQAEESKDKKRTSIRSEQSLQRVFRSLDLPSPIDPEKVRATLRNGELKIELPKAQPELKAAAATSAAA